MRIDLYLKQSRLIKRRKIAREACDKGLVLINGRVSKPSVKVKIGDEITLNLGAKQIVVTITSLKLIRHELMYQLISENFVGQK